MAARARVGNGRRVSDDAEVNRLMVTNNSGKTLVLIAGEIIVGGKQDRIVGEDCVIASSNKPVPVNVYCVEHGRWTERSSFGQSRTNGTAASERRSAARAAAAARAVLLTLRAAGGMAAPNVRAKAQAEKSQDGVWSEVAKLERENQRQLLYRHAEQSLRRPQGQREAERLRAGDQEQAFG